MRLIPLTSSQIAAVGYRYNELTHEQTGGHYGSVEYRGQMVVQFQKGGWYVYDDVPITTFVDVITNPSQGAAFHELVKRGGYKYAQVSPEEIERL